MKKILSPNFSLLYFWSNPVCSHSMIDFYFMVLLTNWKLIVQLTYIYYFACNQCNQLKENKFKFENSEMIGWMWVSPIHSQNTYYWCKQKKVKRQKRKGKPKLFFGNCSIIHSSFFAGKNKEKTLHYPAFFNVRSIAAF